MDRFTQAALSPRSPGDDAQAAAEEKLPARLSGWSVFFVVMGILSIFIGVIVGVVFARNPLLAGYSLLMVAGGILGGVQYFFIAFLVTALSDMRFFLARIDQSLRK